MLRDIVHYRLNFTSEGTKQLTDRFSRLYFDSHVVGKTWVSMSWLGVPLLKCPTDLWTYQELIYELKPDVIIETGTLLGGSALYLASLCDLIGRGRVITIDIDATARSASQEQATVPRSRPAHSRITYLNGSSTSEHIVKQVKWLTKDHEKVVVILDSDHSKEHVLAELHAYAPMVSRGSYLIVEDTNVNGHPVLPGFGPGPMEALNVFLQENRDFEIDFSREKHLLTFNPRGYLRRTA
jgi:cephalosporin hydroxylase